MHGFPRHVALPLLLALTLYCCGTQQRGPILLVPGKATPSPVAPTPWQDAARLLAGMDLPRTSPYYGISQSPPFRRHAREMRRFWQRVRREHLGRIDLWRKANIPSTFERNGVFYPLSSADYANAYAFFPKARDFLFVALEPPGRLPDLHHLTDAQLDAGLTAIRKAVASIAFVNYMQSKVLRRELTNPYLPGSLPLLLLFAGGLGHKVLDVRGVVLDADGGLQDCQKAATLCGGPEENQASGNGPVRGVRLLLEDEPGAEPIHLVYLQLRLRNEAVRTSTPEGRFLSRLSHCSTILKAAVYLLHNDAYAAVRDYVLDHSSLVLQDDSGVPYRFFRGEAWEDRLYGTYTNALLLEGVPSNIQQPLLAERYAERSRPLPFPYGYGELQGPGKSNLMLLLRRPSLAGAP